MRFLDRNMMKEPDHKHDYKAHLHYHVFLKTDQFGLSPHLILLSTTK
ncbi:hypothetical protein I3842_11G013500 [Carya illinoinensis]|uniref:Uncharacterized protein n=1 Tax=Carya illinoinensis TaxID=32201 RepID=A0A922DKV1_CARIL|nr:hypothetical protein I3842_11G013500 [Carya illinoinensis]